MNQNTTFGLDNAKSLELLTSGVNHAHIAELNSRLTDIHSQFAQERDMDYPALQKRLRAWTRSHLQTKDIESVIELAQKIREKFKVFIVVGIGGSDLGGRTLHDTLDHPYHNQLSEERRKGAPEIYFTGDTFDPKRLLALLDILETTGKLDKTCVNIISKSGKTGETISAALVIKERLNRAGVKEWNRQIVATTGQNEQSVLFQMNKLTPFFGMLPVPDGVGGRFSFASPVGLLPMAVTAVNSTPKERVEAALSGYAEAHERFLASEDSSANIAFSLAKWWQLGEQFCAKTDLVFCNYADDARLGDWFVQLYEESLQERCGGLNVIGTRGPTGNHSILNGILRGPHDKLVLLLRWHDLGEDATIPIGSGVGGDLKYFEGLPLSAIQDASCLATCEDYLKNGVPTALLNVPKRDERNLFLLMRTLMDAVAVKGRLQNLALNNAGETDPCNELTYLQDGVEGYKIGTRQKAAEMQQKA